MSECEKEREGGKIETKHSSCVCVCVSAVLFTHTFCKYHIKVDESISIYRNSNKYYYFILNKRE